MAQSIYQSYHHLIFSTKRRYPFIKTKIKEDLHKYISGIMRNLDSPCICINSMPDHIHILFRQSKTKSASEIFYNVKASSSKWMKTNQGIKKFKWQRGYACFSVYPRDLHYVEEYIKNQEKHHRKRALKDEVEKLLKHHKIDSFDPEYFWSS